MTGFAAALMMLLHWLAYGSAPLPSEEKVVGKNRAAQAFGTRFKLL
jgi:hypothetical protein